MRSDAPQTQPQTVESELNNIEMLLHRLNDNADEIAKYVNNENIPKSQQGRPMFTLITHSKGRHGGVFLEVPISVSAKCRWENLLAQSQQFLIGYWQ